MYDIIIIGAGPAGLCAAIYARRAQKSVLVIEKSTFGGQVTFSPKIENYPGFKQISGAELADLMVEQALELGADIEPGTVCGVSAAGDCKTVTTDDGTTYSCKALIIAAGVRHRMLGVPGEAELVGHGISFCAVCDGAFCQGETVAVAGGGNSALQEAVLLSDICEKVIMIQNLDYFTGESALLDILKQKSNVEFITGTLIRGFETKEDRLCALLLEKADGGKTARLEADSLFIAVGLEPDNGAFAEVAAVGEDGYIDTDASLCTGTEGVYACGDCRRKEIRQITTAVSDGAAAALAACRYIDRL